MENLKKGLKVICLKDIKDTIVGKEYSLYKDGYILDESSYPRYMESHVRDGRFKVVEQIQVDDKVLWKGFEGVVVLLDGYGGYVIQLEDGDKISTKNVTKKQPKFCKGEWVKYKYNGETFFTICKEDNDNPNLVKLENKMLIDILETELL